MVSEIRKIILQVDDVGSWKRWVHITNDKLLWFILINNIYRDEPQPHGYDFE